MPFSSLANFEQFLLKLQLVEPQQLLDCKRRLGAAATIDRLINELELRTFLTSYQAKKLRQRESDGLRLGRYKLLYRNASGSFARVFRGCSVDDGQIVAIKVLRQRYAEDPRAVNLFRREGELGKRLKHKNIVPIYEVDTDDEQPYFTMEFVEGGNFRDFIKIRKKFAAPEATKYVLDMAEALEYALSLGFTHRDLKLSNVLLNSQGVAKLVDFGLAGQDHALAAMEEEVDRAIEYATLERGSNAPDNDPRSDLYFLGAIYYELLAGDAPYPPTKRREERRDFRRYRDVRPLREVEPGLPKSVTRIVDRLMDIHPSDRYQTPTEAVQDLRRALNEINNGAAAINTSDSSIAKAPSAPETLVVLEHRAKHQDALRDYFTKHGYRVLVMSDPIRALGRIESDRPAGLILMGDSAGDDLSGVYAAAGPRCRRVGTALVVALTHKSVEWKDKLAAAPGVQILIDKVTLRDIRKALEELRAHPVKKSAK